MLKKCFRYGLAFLLYYSGIIALIRSLSRNKKTIRILAYHRVSDDLEGSAPAIGLKRFRRHIGFLSRHYKIIGLDEAVALLKNGSDAIKGSVAITFDDGFRDILKNALPIIKESRVPVTIFVTSGLMEAGSALWTEKLFQHLKEQNRLKEFVRLRDRLKSMDNQQRIIMLDSLDVQKVESRMLNWQEVKQLSESGLVEIGAHSVSHPVLPNCEKNEIADEVKSSKGEIELNIGRKIFGFSYPAGKFNALVKQIVEEAGFGYACTVDGKAAAKGSDLYSLSRINIDNCPVFVFAVELEGVLNSLRRGFS